MANTITDELNRLIQAKADIKLALQNKGVTVGNSSLLNEYPTIINKIDTSTLLSLIDRSITKVTIPNGITKIGSHTFHQCVNLTDVSINSNITEIGNYSFGKCDKLLQVIIPSSVTTIGTEAFSNCAELISVIFNGNSITKIPTGAFYNCPLLANILIPTSVTELEGAAFQNCTSLTTIKIPASVTKIGNQAFSGCSAMMNIVCMATTPPSISSNTFSSSHYSNVKLHVPMSAVSAYQSASNWSNFVSINGIENIQFEDAKTKQYLLSAGYGSNGEITTADAAALQVFPKYSSVYRLSGRPYIDTEMSPFLYKFGYNTRGRQDVSTFNELKYFNIGEYNTIPRPFNGTSFESMEYPDNCSVIPIQFFYGASKLNHFIIPSSVKSIKSSAFSGCSNLKGLVIPNTVETIENETFLSVPLPTLLSKTPPTIVKTSQYYPYPFSDNYNVYVPHDAVDTYKAALYYRANKIFPIAGISYDLQTLTAQALGRPYGQEMYIDGSLLNTSIYTFTPGAADASHIIEVKCVDPSLGVLDSSTLEVLVEAAAPSYYAAPPTYTVGTPTYTYYLPSNCYKINLPVTFINAELQGYEGQYTTHRLLGLANDDHGSWYSDFSPVDDPDANPTKFYRYYLLNDTNTTLHLHNSVVVVYKDGNNNELYRTDSMNLDSSIVTDYWFKELLSAPTISIGQDRTEYFGEITSTDANADTIYYKINDGDWETVAGNTANIANGEISYGDTVYAYCADSNGNYLDSEILSATPE